MSKISYKYIASNQPVIDYLYKRLMTHLAANHKVVWLVAGGSSIEIATKVAHRLAEAPNLANLRVTLTDERYGPPGHADSNWRQLEDRGFHLKGAKLLPVLDGSELSANATAYANLLNELLAWSNFSISLAGLGADGHIFGIKPHSPALITSSDVVGYKWDDFERLTPTVALIKRLDEIVVYAVGAPKHQPIRDLARDRPAAQQPAQLLKQAKKVTIYNDYKE